LSASCTALRACFRKRQQPQHFSRENYSLPAARGVEFEYDTKNILYVRIDRKRQIPGFYFSAALGHESNEIFLRTLLPGGAYLAARQGAVLDVSPGIVDRKLTHEIRKPQVRRSDRRSAQAHHRQSLQGIDQGQGFRRFAPLWPISKAPTASPTSSTAKPVKCCSKANKPLTADLWQAFAESGITEADVFFPERDDIGLVLSRTLDKDSIRSSKEALIEIYRKLRPGDPPTLENGHQSFPRNVLRSA